MKGFSASLFLLVCSLSLLHCNAQAPTAAPTPSPAPAPAPPFCNITQVILNGGQYSTLLQDLISTNLVNDIQGQINASLTQSNGQGVTLFAPMDSAFKTKTATKLLKGLNSTDLRLLLGYHLLPHYYSLSVLQQASNNVTQTYGGAGTLTISSTNGQVSLATGYDTVNISTTLYDQFPCGVFGIAELLYPTSLFGFPGPAPAPAPSAESPAMSPGSSSASSPKGTALAPSPSSAPASVFSPVPLLPLLLMSVKLLFL